MNRKPTRDKIIKKSPRTQKHTVYRTSDGVRVPGGSTLARVVSFGNPDALMRWAIRLHEEGINFQEAREESATLGTCFHRLVECRHTGETFESEFYPPAYVEQAQKMTDSFFQELERRNLVILESEQVHTSDDFRVGGQLDLVLANKKEPKYPAILGDLKSSNFLGGEHVLQVAGVYRELFAEKYGHYPEEIILFRADRDTGSCRGYPIPEDQVKAAERSVPLVRELYELRKIMERRIT